MARKRAPDIQQPDSSQDSPVLKSSAPLTNSRQALSTSNVETSSSSTSRRSTSQKAAQRKNKKKKNAQISPVEMEKENIEDDVVMAVGEPENLNELLENIPEEAKQMEVDAPVDDSALVENDALAGGNAPVEEVADIGQVEVDEAVAPAEDVVPAPVNNGKPTKRKKKNERDEEYLRKFPLSGSERLLKKKNFDEVPKEKPEEQKIKNFKIFDIRLDSAIKRILDGSYRPTGYPKVTYTKLPRHDWVMKEKDGQDILVQRPKVEHIPRCFACREGGSEENPLIKCGGDLNGEVKEASKLDAESKIELVLDMLESDGSEDEEMEGAAGTSQKKKKKSVELKKKKKTQPSCTTVFHYSCLIEYNDCGFNAQYAARPECQNKILCPSHTCHRCNLNHLKQSAYEGGIINCAQCFRGFHDRSCLPAGARYSHTTTGKGKAKKEYKHLICSQGCLEQIQEETEQVDRGSRTEETTDNEEGDAGTTDTAHATTLHIPAHIDCCYDAICTVKEELIRCKTCPRSYHQKCREVETLDGKPVAQDVCEQCACDAAAPIGIPVLAWHEGKKKLLLGETVHWDLANSGKDYVKLAKTVGYAAVKWLPVPRKSSPIISFVPAHLVVPLIEKYAELAADTQQKKLWRDTSVAFEKVGLDFAPRPHKKVFYKTNASFFGKDKNKIGESQKDHEACNCKCENGQCFSECPCVMDKKECTSLCTGCQNRKVSTGFINPKLEVRWTVEKGYGVYAKEAVKMREFLAEYAGQIIGEEEKKKRLAIISDARDFQAAHYMMTLDQERTVDATQCGNITRCINHSCDPNSGSFKVFIFLKTDKDGNAVHDERLYLEAIRDIAAGEGITFCYNMPSGIKLTVECKCGSKKCVGHMGFRKKVEKEAEMFEEEDENKPVPSHAVNRNSRGTAPGKSKVVKRKRISAISKIEKNQTEPSTVQEPSTQAQQSRRPSQVGSKSAKKQRLAGKNQKQDQ